MRNTYEPAFPALEDFLTRRIYARARPTYHPIATASIDAILKPK